MHNIQVGNVLDGAPMVQGVFEQFIHVPDFGAAIQGVLQAFQAAALDPHLLGMGRGVSTRNVPKAKEKLRRKWA